MIKLIALLLFIMPLKLLAQQKLWFIEERIDFAITEERFSVNGIYTFSNCSETEIKQAILFPFGEGGDSLIIRRIFNLSYSKNIHFEQLNDAVAFKILILPKDTIKVNIAYSRNAAMENTYILESTQTWGKALKKADYSLTIASPVQIDSLSLKPDTLINNVYHWNKQDFYPNADFKIWIK